MLVLFKRLFLTIARLWDSSYRFKFAPHNTRFFVFGISLVAFILSSDAVNSCRYLITEPDGSAIGLYYYESPNNVDGVCQSVAFMKEVADEDIFADEDSWKTAQGLGTAGAALGGIGTLFMFLGFFCKPFANRMCFRFLFPMILIVAGICTILTNIAFKVDMCSDLGSSDDVEGIKVERACTAAAGNAAASGAFILYLVAAVSMFWCMTPWEEPMYKFVDELGAGTSLDNVTHDKSAEPTEGLIAEAADEGMVEENV